MRSIIYVLCALSMPALAQVETAPRVGVGTEARKLTLEETIKLAVQNNLDIQVERTTIQSAKQSVRGAQGVFDAVVLWNPQIESRNTPQANSLISASGKLAERLFTTPVSVRQQTPWQGIFYQVNLETVRQSTNNPFTSISPYWTTRLSAGFGVPLWRYRETDPGRAQLVIRKKQVDQSEVDFETRVIEVVTRAQAAYWDLVAAIEDARVALDGVNLAQEQLDRNKRQIAAGTLAPIELSGSEAELQRRIDTYTGAIGTITVAENALKLVLTPDAKDPLWNDRLTPVDLSAMAVPDTPVSQAVERAYQRRPELKSLDLRVEQNEVQKKLAESAKKPQVNLTANYFISGLAGTPIQSSNPIGSAFTPAIVRINELSELAGLPPLPPISTGGGVPLAFIGGLGTAYGNMLGADYQSVVAGVSFEWNPRNRTAEAALAQTQIAERRLKLGRVQIEQGIEAQVRNSLQAVETARQKISAAEASERAAQEKLDSETRLFQTGESTNFLVLTRQSELLDSRRRTVVAKLLLNRAVAQLQQAVGATLDVNHVLLQ